MSFEGIFWWTSSGVYRWTWYETTWPKVGGAAGMVYGGHYGLVATDPNTGALFYYMGGTTWQQIGLAGAEFVVTGDSIYGLTPDRSAVYRYNGFPGTTWTYVGGAANQIVAAYMAQ